MPHDLSMSMYDSTETHYSSQIEICSKKIQILHALHNLAKKEKNENRCCFEAHSKATEVVTFHTHELMGHV